MAYPSSDTICCSPSVVSQGSSRQPTRTGAGPRAEDGCFWGAVVPLGSTGLVRGLGGQNQSSGRRITFHVDVIKLHILRAVQVADASLRKDAETLQKDMYLEFVFSDQQSLLDELQKLCSDAKEFCFK